MRARLDFYGVAVDVVSDAAPVVERLREDFRFFPGRGPGEDRVRIELRVGAPPWDRFRRARPLFRTTGTVVRRAGRLRYVDHGGRALVAYDLGRDEGTVFAEDPGGAYAAAYLLITSRVGDLLDRRGLHRFHALGVVVGGRALLFLGRSGLGKTTFALELMRNQGTGWLSDEIPLVDRKGTVWAFPLPLRVEEGTAIPWPPEPGPLEEVPRFNSRRRVRLDLAHLLPRVVPSAPLGAVFLCRRAPAPAVRRAGRWEAFLGLSSNAVLGQDFPHTKAYYLPLAPWPLARWGAHLASRARMCAGIAARVPVFRFDMGPNVPENAAALREALGVPAPRLTLRPLSSS